MAAQKPSILVIDDIVANIKVLVSLLKDSYAVFFATDGPAGIALTASQTPDLVLLDISMPDMDGYEVCRLLKANQATAKIPVIFITALNDVEDETKGLSLGAIDYITKPFSPAIMLARIKNHIEHARDQCRLQEAHALLAEKIKELDEKNQALEILSLTDRLTGVYNRRMLEQTLQAELPRAKRYGKPFAVIMLDVDRFKPINDAFGHDVGDSVLVQVAGAIVNEARETDVAGRWGGEEFLLICPETGVAVAAAMAERLRRGLEGHVFPHGETVTASFGVAAYRAGDEVHSLVRRADQALYRAKQNGRNRVETEAAPSCSENPALFL